jgi:5-methylcytosine-specific restriction endonuclease McrA
MTSNDEYYDFVMEMFRHKCVRCGRNAVNVHEIIPRSRLPKKWMLPENRVAICLSCHFWAHRRGAKSSAEELRELREKRLLEYAINTRKTE